MIQAAISVGDPNGVELPLAAIAQRTLAVLPQLAGGETYR